MDYSQSSCDDTFRRISSQQFARETILLTGCSGFLGKVILEKLLRSFNCRKVYILLRPKKGRDVGYRFETEILKSRIFDSLRVLWGQNFESRISDLLIPIAGDLQIANLGLCESDRARLTSEVSVIIHAAASVDFDLPIELATSINIDGSLEMLNLARECTALKCHVHVSTCYVNANRTGFIRESVYDPSGFDVEEVYKYIKSSSSDTLANEKQQIIREWPNTYTFTKFLAEHLLIARKGSVPLVICRPSIIAAALHEPVPGWTDSISAASAVFLACGMGICPPLPGSIWNLADIIPVDLCSNMIIMSAALGVSGCLSDLSIVHCGTSSSEEPMTWFAAADTVSDIFAIHPPANQLMVRDILLFDKKTEFERQTFFRSTFPQRILGLMEKWLPKQHPVARARKALAIGDRIVSVFGHFTKNEWIFDSHFLNQFRPLVEPPNLLPTSHRIDWHEYMHLVCYGMRKFCLGMDDAQLPLPESLRGDVLERSTVWRLQNREENPRKQSLFEWAWNGVPMDYQTPRNIEKRVVGTFPKSNHRAVVSIVRSLETRFNYSTVRLFGFTLQSLFRQMFDRIQVNESGIENLRKLIDSKSGPILLVPTHRSYLDFLLLSFVLFAYHVKVPFIVAGEDFKKIPGVRSILRNSGAFFMKRKLDHVNDPLYCAVFKAYFQQAILQHGLVEFFVEGTRSRSGLILHNKNGLLSFATDLLDQVNDIHIVPVAMTFERVLECESFVPEVLGNSKKRESLSRILSAVTVLRTNYGRANIVFDRPLSAREHMQRTDVDGLGKLITSRLSANLTVMSTHVVAAIILSSRSMLGKAELIKQVEQVRDFIREYKDVHFMLPTEGSCAFSVSTCLMTHFKDVVQVSNDVVTVRKGEFNALMLAYYRNQLVSLFGTDAIILSVLASLKSRGSEELVARTRMTVHILGVPFLSDSIEERIEKLKRLGCISSLGDSFTVCQGGITDFLLNLALPVLDSLWISLETIRKRHNQNLEVHAVAAHAVSFAKSLQVGSVASTSYDALKTSLHSLVRAGVFAQDGTCDRTELDGLIRWVGRLREPHRLLAGGAVEGVFDNRAYNARL